MCNVINLKIKLINFMGQSHSWDVDSRWSTNSPPFMELITLSQILL
jgi:hypothetical protein